MKVIRIIFLLVFISVGNVWSKTFSVEDYTYANKSINDVLNIIIDYNNYCKKGCTYGLTDVNEIRILKWVDDNHFYTWTDMTSNGRNYPYFLYVTIKELEDSIRITSVYPQSNEIKKLESTYKLSHKPSFREYHSSWYLKSKNNNKTYAKYSGKFEMDSFIAAIISKHIKRYLKQKTSDLLSPLENKKII